VLGSVILVKEHYQRQSEELRSAELLRKINSLESNLAEADARANESRRLQNQIFGLERDNRELQERNSVCGERIVALEAESKRLAKELEDSWRLRALAQGTRESDVRLPAAAPVK